MSCCTSDFWDDAANVTLLRTLWAQTPPLSTRDIGEAMKISKNAVVGKAHRLGLPPRPSPIRRRDPDAPPQVRASLPGTVVPLPSLAAPVPSVAMPPPRVARPKRAVAPPQTTPAPPVVAPVRPPPAPKPCCWPLGDPRTPEFRFCGAAALPGRPYCPAHCGAAFTKAPALRLAL